MQKIGPKFGLILMSWPIWWWINFISLSKFFFWWWAPYLIAFFRLKWTSAPSVARCPNRSPNSTGVCWPMRACQPRMMCCRKTTQPALWPKDCSWHGQFIMYKKNLFFIIFLYILVICDKRFLFYFLEIFFKDFPE